ncbi:VOC family protein [Micromonospora sp. CPCC 205371]|nr:VOC family protein [Micromonospora sp. CPCC 205371]
MSEANPHQHHTIDYIELTVTDLAEAKRFYTEASAGQSNADGPGSAGIRGHDGEVGGLRLDQEARPSGGGPLVLLYSTDLDQTVAAVRKAGGEVVNGPYDFPGGRRFHFTDPSGNELGAWAEA